MNVLNDPFESFVRWLRFSTLLDVRPCLNLNYNDRVYWNSYEGLNIPEQYQGCMYYISYINYTHIIIIDYQYLEL